MEAKHLDCHGTRAGTQAIARASDSESEEDEEEFEEGGEEAASIEAETEEAASEASGTPPSGTKSGAGVVLSQLRLTARASAALERHHPTAAAIWFSFTLSAPSELRVTLVERTGGHGQQRWTALPDSTTLDASRGHVSRGLVGHNRLTPGRYRLTVKPLAGRPRSIYLSTRR